MIFVGIDPGLDGGVAVINSHHSDEPHVFDTPTGKDGKKRIYMPGEMRKVLLDGISPFVLNDGSYQVRAYLERVHSMPKQGVASSFNFGHGYGLWEGILIGLNWPYEKVTPLTWMKVVMAGQQRGKNASRAKVQELFPSLTDEVSRVKDDGRADAVLIAEFGRRQSVRG